MSQPATVLPELYAQLDRIDDLSGAELDDLRRSFVVASKARDPQVRGGGCYGLSVMARERKDFDEALSWQRQATLLCPADPAMHNHMGIILILMNRPEEAVEHLVRAVELSHEQRWQELMNLSRALSLLGDSEGALEMFERAALLVSPKERRAWLRVTHAAAEMGLDSIVHQRLQGMRLSDGELARLPFLRALVEQRLALEPLPG